LKIKCTVKTVIDKSGKVILVIAAGSIFWFNTVQSSHAVGVSIPPASPPPITRVLPSPGNRWKITNSKTRLVKKDLIALKSNTDILMLIYLTDPRLSSNPEILKIVTNLRGGSCKTTLIGNLVLLAVVSAIWLLNAFAGGFVTPPANPGWNLPRGLYDPPGLVRPVDCGTGLYAGSPTQSLKTWADRNQPNPKDRWILVEGRPELVLRRGQSQFKTKDHGALAGLPYIIKNNGGTLTLITEKNVDVFMDVVELIVEDPNSEWFEEGTYQQGTDREVDSINVFSEKHNRIAVFERETGQFITFCEPNQLEIDDLLETGNFGGGLNWFKGGKNLPPVKPFEDTPLEKFTPLNSFESDVMGITPVTPMNETSPNEIPNQGFTPMNSFESDVLGVTAFDSDWQI